MAARKASSGRTEPSLSLLAAVRRELDAGGAVSVSPGLVALALKLAECLEERPSALMAKELRETLGRLRELAPPKEREDGIDQLRARRQARGGGAGA
jgi:hypothetical protein